MIHDVSGRQGMGLGSRSWFGKPEPQVFQDGLDDLPGFYEADDPHGSPTLRTSQGIGLVDLMDQPGPGPAVCPRTFIGFQNAVLV